jgi:hypothetical protein
MPQISSQILTGTFFIAFFSSKHFSVFFLLKRKCYVQQLLVEILELKQVPVLCRIRYLLAAFTEYPVSGFKNSVAKPVDFHAAPAPTCQSFGSGGSKAFGSVCGSSDLSWETSTVQ